MLSRGFYIPGRDPDDMRNWGQMPVVFSYTQLLVGKGVLGPVLMDHFQVLFWIWSVLVIVNSIVR